MSYQAHPPQVLCDNCQQAVADREYTVKGVIGDQLMFAACFACAEPVMEKLIRGVERGELENDVVVYWYLGPWAEFGTLV